MFTFLSSFDFVIFSTACSKQSDSHHFTFFTFQRVSELRLPEGQAGTASNPSLALLIISVICYFASSAYFSFCLSHSLLLLQRVKKINFMLVIKDEDRKLRHEIIYSPPQKLTPFLIFRCFLLKNHPHLFTLSYNIFLFGCIILS